MPETGIICSIPGNHREDILVFTVERTMKKATSISGKTIVGIDYGNKYAGTTVICYNSRQRIQFVQSSKNADADAFLLNELAYLQPDLIMIDAPLSLPGVYWLGSDYKDHFFRSCDRELKAMSPMFLGGLTARAINLTKKMNGTEVRETYPRKLVDILQLPVAQYKDDMQVLGQFTEKLKKISGAEFNEAQITSWHHLDAFLALLSGFRYLEKNDQRFGIPEEGIIIV
jgi:predicted nuclease with RNAse H fold